MSRGNNRNKIFRSFEDYDYYLQLVAIYKEIHPFELYHYCLMPTHIHYLTQVRDARSFSSFMKRTNLAYYHYFHKKYHWVGHLWQNRFKSQPVGKDEYFIQCGKYIELNPVRKKLVLHPSEYAFSSYGYYFAGEANKLITMDPFFEEMGRTAGERRINYDKLVVSDAVTDSYHKKVWGSAMQEYRELQKLKRNLAGS